MYLQLLTGISTYLHLPYRPEFLQIRKKCQKNSIKCDFRLLLGKIKEAFCEKNLLQQQPTCCSGVSPCIAFGTPPFRLKDKRTEIRYIFSIRRTKHKISTTKKKSRNLKSSFYWMKRRNLLHENKESACRPLRLVWILPCLFLHRLLAPSIICFSLDRQPTESKPKRDFS